MMVMLIVALQLMLKATPSTVITFWQFWHKDLNLAES